MLHDLTERRRAEEELAVARARDEIFHERERIARDLHDLIIQRLFAAGMAIESAINRVLQPELASELRNVVEDLDATIIEIRSTIFALGHNPELTSSLRAQLLAVVSDAVKALGFEPQIHFVGPVDTMVPAEVVEHLLATVREALSNVARHSQASSVEVSLQAGEEIVLEVNDNGRGIGDVSRRGGLANLTDRAETLGGTLMVRRKNGGGTRLVWSVPGLAPSRNPHRILEDRDVDRELHQELPTQ